MPETTTQFKEPKGEGMKQYKPVAPVVGSWHISSPLGFFNCKKELEEYRQQCVVDQWECYFNTRF